MAIVVIVLMIGFIGGSYISSLSKRSTGVNKTVANMLSGKKITNKDLMMARRDLEILQMIKADVLLRALPLQFLDAKDMRSLLLAELIFPDKSDAVQNIAEMKQAIRKNEYKISSKQIDDIYRAKYPPNIYWFLLKTETQKAGMIVGSEQAGSQLASIIPQLFQGATYQQVIGSIVNGQNISEADILQTFAQLLAVYEYSRVACSIEDITASQIMHKASWENETLDLQFVKFGAKTFADEQQPAQQEIMEHFDKYKNMLPADVSQENPYGFGYKMPDLLQFEYIALNLDEVKEITTPVKSEEVEEYYERNKQAFIRQVPSDPNDPNSPLVQTTLRFAQVGPMISSQMMQQRVNSKAMKILEDARAITETALENIDEDPAKITSEKYKELAGDYTAAAKKVGQDNNINIYTGTTGLLSMLDFNMDPNLSGLYLDTYGYSPIGFAKLAFAVDGLGISQLGPFEGADPKLFQNIGPVKDNKGKIMLLVRIIDTRKSAAPENIDLTISKKTISTGGQQQAEDFSLKEKIIDNVKALNAMDTAKEKADEFKKEIVKSGWVNALAEFNNRYGKKDSETDPNTFEIQDISMLRRMSQATLETMSTQIEGTAGFSSFFNQAKLEKLFRDSVYDLVPQDANSLRSVPYIMEFEPELTYYCFKKVEVNRIDEQQYEQIKAIKAFREDAIQSQSMTVVHYNPENIAKRMDFEFIEPETETSDANTPQESEEI
jgi:hypothetical protein